MSSIKSISKRSSDEKVVLDWNEINLSVWIKDGINSSMKKTMYLEKNILRNLNGRAESGQLLAIMGPTGCGKTSLMNVLSARVSRSSSQFTSLTGHIMVNGKPRNDETFRRMSAYVQQDDLLYAHLTVNETLTLAAHFFLPLDTRPGMKAQLVSGIIAEIGLVKAADTIIGDNKVRGVSGGERKRACIAVQLISDPAVLFLDEPTSGLDAFQSQSVMECMKELAGNGRLVISVIHQPRSSIYAMIDQILLLTEGHTAFFGSAHDAVSYFENIGFSCPPDFNPADYFLDILSPDSRSKDKDTESKDRISNLTKAWKREEYSISQKVLQNNDKIVDSTADILLMGNSSFSFRRSLLLFRILSWRSFTESKRNTGALAFKLIFNLIFSFLLSGIFSDRSSGQKSIRNKYGLLFFVVIFLSFGNVLGVVNTFAKERIIVNRERSAHAYDTVTYFFAKFITELPFNMFPPFMFACILYWLAAFKHEPVRFVIFFLILMLLSVGGIALGMAISAFAPTVEAAQAMSPFFLIIGIIFGGFYINVHMLPVVANWLPYLSMFKWSFEALCFNEFQGTTFTCDGTTSGACITTGEGVLKSLSFSDSSITNSVMGLCILTIIYFCAAVLILHFSSIKYLPLGFTGKKVHALKLANGQSHSEKVIKMGSYAPVQNFDSKTPDEQDQEKKLHDGVQTI